MMVIMEAVLEQSEQQEGDLGLELDNGANFYRL